MVHCLRNKRIDGDEILSDSFFSKSLAVLGQTSDEKNKELG